MNMWDQFSDEMREGVVLHFIDAIARSSVPEHLRGGLVRYMSDGILPGGFLQAVLCNNLMEAAARADPTSARTLVPIVQFLTDHAPASSWGSREKVLAWTTTPGRLEM
jgi:hypothetical protein